MNYLTHYNALIHRARDRTLVGYRERHHIIPKCMGGSNEPRNLVALTAEEHYVAHQLLVKIYPDVRGLITAAMYMAKQCSGNKAYGWIRRRLADLQRGKRGNQMSPETKEKISITKRGRPGLCGWQHTAESKARNAAAHRGKKLSPQHRAKIGAALAGRVRSPETIAKTANAQRGKKRKPMSNEAKAKISRSLIGNQRAVGNTSRRGIVLTPETRAKMSAARRGRALHDLHSQQGM